MESDYYYYDDDEVQSDKKRFQARDQHYVGIREK